MDLNLTGMSSFISGSTAGIGFTVAIGLAKQGANVTLNGRSAQRVDEAVERHQQQVPAGAGSISGIVADLSTLSGAKLVTDQLPHVDILVNNLGVFDAQGFSETPDADWTRLFEANVMSGVRLSRHYLPRMTANDWGRIVFVSSEAAVRPRPQMLAYSMTKTCQLAIAAGLARLTKATGVTVNSVLPGPTASEGMMASVGKQAADSSTTAARFEEQLFDSQLSSSLAQRFLSVEQAASPVVFLCTRAAAATNGATLRADGGVLEQVIP